MLVGGSGYQTEASRWGDHTMLTIDPTDDCTFWYVGEYYGTIGPYPWQTRVGAFDVGGCGQCPLVGRSTPAVDRAPGAVRLTWTQADRAEVYDVIEGGLLALRSSSGAFTAATTGCAADDVAGTSVDLSGPDPVPGDGMWYLVRGVLNGCRGSLDDGGAHLAASRDDGVQAAAAACP